MSEPANISVQSIEHLKISPLYAEIFRHFKIPRQRLYEKIKYEGFNRYSTLKIRRVNKKREYEILCGVGRFEAKRQFARETRYPNKPDLGVRCQVVEQEDDENGLALILSESIDAKRFFKGYSPLQFYLLYKLNQQFSGNYLPKDLVHAEFDISETIYQYLNTSYNFVISHIKEIHPEFAQVLASETAENVLTNKLQDLKLINHALEKGEWTELTGFFYGKTKISAFYSEHCGGEKSTKKKGAKNKRAPAASHLAEPAGRLQNEKSAEETLPEQILTDLILTEIVPISTDDILLSPEPVQAEDVLPESTDTESASELASEMPAAEISEIIKAVPKKKGKQKGKKIIDLENQAMLFNISE